MDALSLLHNVSANTLSLSGRNTSCGAGSSSLKPPPSAPLARISERVLLDDSLIPRAGEEVAG